MHEQASDHQEKESYPSDRPDVHACALRCTLCQAEIGEGGCLWNWRVKDGAGEARELARLSAAPQQSYGLWVFGDFQPSGEVGVSLLQSRHWHPERSHAAAITSGGYRLGEDYDASAAVPEGCAEPLPRKSCHRSREGRLEIGA